jgi:hypothetical protein
MQIYNKLTETYIILSWKKSLFVVICYEYTKVLAIPKHLQKSNRKFWWTYYWIRVAQEEAIEPWGKKSSLLSSK